MKWTPEHREFRKSLRQFIREEINPNVEKWEEAGEFPAHEILKKMGELGFLGLSYPEEYGGQGLDFSYNVAMAEELAQIDCAGVPTAITVHTDMATPALAEFGSHELKKMFLEPANRGEMVAAVAITEPNAGSDVAAIQTRAESDGDYYVINGNKIFITNGCQADWYCTLVRTTPGRGFRGMSLVIIPRDTPGVTVARKLKKLGNHSSDTAEIFFENVRIPKSYRIGEEGMGFILQMLQFQKERLIASVLTYAGAEKIIKMTIEYCRQRKTFGMPLIDNQWIHFHLAELITEVEFLRRMCYYCAEQLIEGEDITREVSMAKLKAGRLARKVADTCLQFHGGMGYMEEYPLARYFRDARLVSIGGGTDEIMLGIIAKYEGILPKRNKSGE